VACDRLLSYRVEMKVAGKRISDVLNRIHVAVPKPRGGSARPPVIPPGVAQARSRRDAGEKRRTEKDMQVGVGVGGWVRAGAGGCLGALQGCWLAGGAPHGARCSGEGRLPPPRPLVLYAGLEGGR
jgi:hypothetical protein